MQDHRTATNAETSSAYSHPGVTVNVHESSVDVLATNGAMHDWATRPGHAWPCSQLAELGSLCASFDTTGLVDLNEPARAADLGVDEFNAFTSDVLAYALNSEHPCYFVTVGQFVRHGR